MSVSIPTSNDAFRPAFPISPATPVYYTFRVKNKREKEMGISQRNHPSIVGVRRHSRLPCCKDRRKSKETMVVGVRTIAEDETRMDAASPAESL